ncbi:MAG: hypothetical protein KAH86_03645 [Methanosarcinales archaeon]|nr:hypothetical protein [Methanosarcinales archaeon]
MFAKKTILLIVLILTMLQPAAALSGDKITFTNIPGGLDLVVGESTDFNVTLENTGVYSDVCIQLRNIPDGITAVGNNDYKLMDKGKSVTYDLTISADENIEPGIYKFEIADSSNYDFRTWTTINLAILNVGDSPVYNIIEEEEEEEEEDVGEETEDVIPEINEVDIEEESNSAEQDDDDSITEESSDSIMDTTVALTYTELSIAAVVEAISITIINLTLVAVVGIVRKRKHESTDTTKDENATDDDYVHEDNQDDTPNGEYDNEDDAV